MNNKTIEMTKQAFSNEFLKLCPKINEISEILWFIFRMGGSVPKDIITTRFTDFPNNAEYLTGAGIIEIAGNECMFTEEFEERVLKAEPGPSEITNILLESYSEKLIKNFNLENLFNSLSTVLGAVIHVATPDKPAFLNKVLRVANSGNTKLMLEYYLHRCLGLVQPTDFGVELTDKAKEIINENPELQNFYMKNGAKVDLIEDEDKIL